MEPCLTPTVTSMKEERFPFQETCCAPPVFKHIQKETMDFDKENAIFLDLHTFIDCMSTDFHRLELHFQNKGQNQNKENRKINDVHFYPTFIE